MKAAVVIPSLNPDGRLLALVSQLSAMGLAHLLIVNDGSKSECLAIFKTLRQQYGCVICEHKTNLGKGASLKTGIREASVLWPDCIGYVTADADGQHLPKDILKIVNTLEENQSSMILGTREFKGKNIPFKSKWGNRITSTVFRLSTSVRCPDTQTGLRGIPKSLVDFCLGVQGDRFEYEMNQLLEAARSKISFVFVPIETVYLEKNNSTHFHAVSDSIRIYFNIVRFGLSSLVSAVLDLTLFTAFTIFLFGETKTGILLSTVFARICSGSFNYLINKKWVFQSNAGHRVQAIKYFTLFCAQMLTSWLLVSGLSFLPIHITVIKLVIDSGLFLLSYQIQKRFIFNDEKAR